MAFVKKKPLTKLQYKIAKILHDLGNGPVSLTKLRDVSGLSYDRVYRVLAALERRGVVVNERYVRGGSWRMAGPADRLPKTETFDPLADLPPEPEVGVTP